VYLQAETADGKKETRDKIHTVTAGDNPKNPYSMATIRKERRLEKAVK